MRRVDASLAAAAFFGLDTSKRVSVQDLQRAGSLAARYSKVLIGTRPFTRPFFAALSTPGRTSVGVKRSVKLSVLIWRAVALSLLHDPVGLAVPLEWVRRTRPSAEFKFTSDAGPEGLGLVIGLVLGPLLGSLSYRLPFAAVDPKYQNLREFTGCILGMLVAYRFAKGRPVAVWWVSDNVSALSWARADAVKSRPAQAAFLIFTWLKIRGQISLVRQSHMPGVEMGDVDALSRFRVTQSLSPDIDLAQIFPRLAFDALFDKCAPPVKGSQLRCWKSLLIELIKLIDACLVKW